MSEVHARLRKASSLQYLKKATALQNRVIQLVMNTKKVPKKWRYNLCNEVIRTVMNITKNVIAANSSFPKDEESLKKRIEYQANVTNGCILLHNQLCTMIDVIKSLKPEMVIPSITELSSFMETMDKWKATTRKIVIKKDDN